MTDANSFLLQGGALQVDYSATSFAGKPILGYHNSEVSRQFTGDQIETTTTPIGTLVTVVLSIVPDLATTMFSLLIPPVPLPEGATSEPLKTIGITTVKKMNFFGHPVGQLDSYTVQDLDGTARFITA